MIEFFFDSFKYLLENYKKLKVFIKLVLTEAAIEQQFVKNGLELKLDVEL